MEITPITRARELRNVQTVCEKLFWKCIRNRAFKGLKFTRQFPIVFKTEKNKKKFFVADFYCHEYKLDIEIDGDVHDEQKDYDEFRDKILKQIGFNVLRFSNGDVVNNISWVLGEVEKFVVSNR